MPETFSPSSKGKFSSFLSSSFLGGGLVNNGGRGEGGEREKGSESESWHAQPGVVTSAVLGRICKNEPLLHLLEVSLLHAL